MKHPALHNPTSVPIATPDSRKNSDTQLGFWKHYVLLRWSYKTSNLMIC